MTMLEQILEKIRKKGWNLYEIGAVQRATDKDIERGPTDSLVLGRLYVLFPSVDEPRSPQQVHEALRRVNAQPPYSPQVQYKGRHLPIPYLSFQEKRLLVRGSIEAKIQYNEFCQSLDTLNVPPGPN